MKTTKLMMLPLATALGCISPMLLAQTETELDMTMTIIEEGQGPEGLVRRIRLPSPEAVAGDQLSLENGVAAGVHLADQVESEAVELVGEAAEVLTDSIKDTLSIDGAGELPDNIVDNLPDDLPLIDGITDDVDDELPVDGELPIDNPLGTVDGMMMDSVNEATEITDGIDESISNSIDEAANDMVDDIDSDIGEAAEDTTDGILEQTNSIIN